MVKKAQQDKRSRARMPVSQRAKQFMPFAAVEGLDAALRQKELELKAEKDPGRPIPGNHEIRN